MKYLFLLLTLLAGLVQAKPTPTPISVSLAPMLTAIAKYKQTPTPISTPAEVQVKKPSPRPTPTAIILNLKTTKPPLPGMKATVNLADPSHRLRHPSHHKGWKPKVKK